MNAIAGLARPLKLATLLVVTLPLGGCWITTGTAVTDACAFWRPISWSTKDTSVTIEEVKINNARQRAWCGTR